MGVICRSQALAGGQPAAEKNLEAVGFCLLEFIVSYIAAVVMFSTNC